MVVLIEMAGGVTVDVTMSASTLLPTSVIVNNSGTKPVSASFKVGTTRASDVQVLPGLLSVPLPVPNGPAIRATDSVAIVVST